jgi:hypothetical protein
VVLLGIVLILAGGATFVRCEASPPELLLGEHADELVVGADGIEVSILGTDADSGIKHLEVRLRHAKGETALGQVDPPGNPIVGGLSSETAATVSARIDPKAMDLAEGDAVLVAEATDWSWANLLAGNSATLEIPVTVDRTAPRVSVSSGLTYVRRGGAGLVRYRLNEEVAEHGVSVGDAIFRGYPVPGAAEGERIAIFAIPRDASGDARIRVFAADAAGNRADVGWPVRVLERKFDRIEIRLSNNFMGNKVPSLAGELGIAGKDDVAVFQVINRDERARNEDTIRGIVVASGGERFFEGAFMQMKNSAVTSQFAEHRTYLVGGEKISEAIHYGYDLASVSGAPIEAANAGVVLHAEPLGIYGNCVILDHGLGLTSLYAHLSQIDVNPGDRVTRGQALGRSGATGLAGGDHLHFGILAGTTYVDPKEWWDAKWVRDHVDPALP